MIKRLEVIFESTIRSPSQPSLNGQSASQVTVVNFAYHLNHVQFSLSAVEMSQVCNNALGTDFVPALDKL